MKGLKKWGLFLSLVIYVTLVLVYSNKQGFWHDEIYTLSFLKGTSAYNFEGSDLYNEQNIFSIEKIKVLLNNDNFIDNFYLQIQHIVFAQ